MPDKISAAGGKFESVGPDHPVNVLAQRFAELSMPIAGSFNISQWEVATAYANAAAHILASSEDMPREQALGRLDDLLTVMRGTYEMRKVSGHA